MGAAQRQATRDQRGAPEISYRAASAPCPTTAINSELIAWVRAVAALTQPAAVHWCDGSQTEYDSLCRKLVETGTFIRLDEAGRPSSYLARSDPGDIARTEGPAFLCSAGEADAGPTNIWLDPGQMRERLTSMLRGAMRGRTMYVVPFSMGPVGSPVARIGVQLTDSTYVAASLRLVTRIGAPALTALGEGVEFVRCLHSVGYPLAGGRADVPWPCDAKSRWLALFPESREVWSYGSGYGANALLSVRCVALRIASQLAREEGWLAEHMLILKLTSPEGRAKYLAGAFPPGAGRTQLAMLTPTLPGWKAETIGTEVAWLNFGPDGRLRAINPEAGFFGTVAGTNPLTNPNTIELLRGGAIFTNCALTDDRDVWWEGLTDAPPKHLIDWRGEHWTSDSGHPAAHPDARFTAPAAQCPSIAAEWNDPEGVPIDAFVFGSRRSTVVPLVREAFDWNHGVFLGATMSSETQAAGDRDRLSFDPFAMLRFCGYHMGDYLAHWLEIGARSNAARLPRIFSVNWFRRDADGRLLWPGYGDNSRVLEWIFRRCDGQAAATETPAGLVPAPGALNTDGLHLSSEAIAQLLRAEPGEWLAELPAIREHLDRFGDRLPHQLGEQLRALADTLWESALRIAPDRPCGRARRTALLPSL